MGNSALLSSSMSLVEYYDHLAKDGAYERAHNRPDRQAEIGILTERTQLLSRDRRTLELACGTGNWTKSLSVAARSVLAIDLSASALMLATARVNQPNTTFRLSDIFSLSEIDGNFEAIFAAFWWSHIPKERISAFVGSLLEKASVGANIFFIDNTIRDQGNRVFSHTDDFGNTYIDRKIPGGPSFRLLKNYPHETELRRAFSVTNGRFQFIELDHYWLAHFEFFDSPN